MENVSVVGFIRCFVDIIATAFNVSVMVFICRKRRKDINFRSCFFSLYLANSAAECAFTIAVRALKVRGI